MLPRRQKLKMFSLLALGLFWGCESTGVEPEADSVAGVFLNPATLTLAAGAEGSLTLSLEGIDSSIFAISLRIEHDPAVVMLSSQTAFSTAGFFGSGAIAFIDADSSLVHLAVTLTQGEAARSGSGDLVDLMFTGMAPGVTTIEIVPGELRFYDASGAEIIIPDLETGSASLTVQ